MAKVTISPELRDALTLWHIEQTNRGVAWDKEYELPDGRIVIEVPTSIMERIDLLRIYPNETAEEVLWRAIQTPTTTH